MALDIERGRDHGIGSYNEVRVALGLPPSPASHRSHRTLQVQQELQAAYGNVNNIDAFEGGLAEDQCPGPTSAHCSRPFSSTSSPRLSNGDRFFYLNETFKPDE